MKGVEIATQTRRRTARPRHGGPEEPHSLRGEFDQVALTHHHHLYHRALGLCRDAVDAEDLVQETYLRALTSFDQFTAGTNCRAWLMTILRHAFVSRITRGAREVPGLDEGAVERALARCTGLTSTPEEEFFQRTIGDRRLARAMDALPPSFREVVVLADVEELSYREIAQMCELPIGTVMSRLFRARRLLRKALRARPSDCESGPAAEGGVGSSPPGKAGYCVPDRPLIRRSRGAIDAVMPGAARSAVA